MPDRNNQAEILIFTTQLFPSTGGFSQVIDTLSGRMESFGFRTQLLAPIKENSTHRPYSITPIRFLHNLYPLVTDYYKRYERIMELNLEILYQTRPFNMIHAHLAYPAGYCAVRWGRRKGIPVIITCHGHDINNVDDIPYEPDVWEVFQNKMVEAFHLADAVTVPSRSMAEKLKSWGIQTSYIPSGVNLNQIPPIPPPQENEPFILTIGRFNKVKGFDLLLESFTILAHRHQNLRLVVFGEGCGIPPLISQSLAKELKGRVTLISTGSDEKKKWDLLRRCILYVCPSRMEGFGIAVLEAMACAKPVVAFAVGGLTDLIENKKNGLLVSPYDTEAMAEAIDQILNDSERAKDMAEESRNRATRFDWSIILDQYQGLYHKVLA
jgi:glycosyltransferase involved in cell wall biosynthesis